MKLREDQDRENPRTDYLNLPIELLKQRLRGGRDQGRPVSWLIEAFIVAALRF